MQALTEEEVDESLQAIVETFCRDSPNPSVVVVDGDGVKVRIERGHLEVSDGLGPYRRVRRYAKATHGLSRVVVIGASGSVSLDAMRWCGAVGIGIVVIDPRDGAVLITSGACSVDDARLRRSQALALATDAGLAVARYLIGTKLAGQAAVAEELDDPNTAETIRRLAASLDECASLDEVRQYEAAAANLYWRAWEAVPVQFIRRDLPRVPTHWQRFEGRRSAVNPGTARSATDPVNALLNYCFRLVEAEARLATLALGLDPGFGILHADVRNRDGFVLDLMEAARPAAERYVAELLRVNHFQRKEFEEDSRGVVRVLSPLSHRLTEAMPAFGAKVAPVAEHVAQLLGDASPYEVGAPAVLSRSKHKEAARRRLGDGVKTPPLGPNASGMSPRRKARQRPTKPEIAALPVPVCRRCGGAIPIEADRERPRGSLCKGCLEVRRKEIGVEMAASSRAHSEEVLNRTGSRPTHTMDARVRRQAGNTTQRALQREWEADHQGEVFETSWFRTKVLPGLATLSVTTIASATGMSASAAGKVRSGGRVPHPRHWGALAGLTGPHGGTVPADD